MGRTPNRLTITAALAVIIALAACDDDITDAPRMNTFSFESDLQGWNVAGTDLDNPPVQWNIEQTTEFANEGDGSVRLTLDNMNDAGKIWIVRSFDGEPGQTYRADIRFDFGTQDWGSVNLWTIIAGAHTEPPESGDDLDFRDNTGNGASQNSGYQWLEKSYTSTVTANAEGEIFVAIGVWGTFEVERTYFIDDVNIVLEET